MDIKRSRKVLTPRSALLGMLAVSAVLLGTLSAAEKEKKPVDGGKPITSKAEKSPAAAATVDFAIALGLSFDSLGSLGVRIDQAHKASDPIGLANAANELAVAEKVSGKKAAITAEALHKEAVELAKLRALSKELAALALMTRDEGAAKQLHELAAKAEKREADEVAAFKSGEKPRGANTLRVRNFHNYTVTVYVDGGQVGHVYAFGEYTYYINKKYRAVALVARGGGAQFGPRYIEGDYDNYTWNLE